MSMQKLRGIRNTGAYTAQRNMVEHLLRLEEIILQEPINPYTIPGKRKLLAQHIQQYKEQHHLNNPFGIEDIQKYLLATTEKELDREKSRLRGIYTSTLIEQAEGNEPITIDMQGKKIGSLLHTINTPRHITINNTTGDWTGAYAGSNRGQAHLTINNTQGNWTGIYAGYDHGQAHLTINNTRGDHTGQDAGSNNGTAHLTIKNTKGNQTGRDAGNYDGRAYLTIINNQGNYAGTNSENGRRTTIVAYNCQGTDRFFGHQGILIINNPDQTPRIKNIYGKKKKQIRHLISQNASPEDIMAYLRRCT